MVEDSYRVLHKRSVREMTRLLRLAAPKQRASSWAFVDGCLFYQVAADVQVVSTGWPKR